MFNKKSFVLNNNDNQDKTAEQIYEEKKCRCCKCVIFSLLCGFILLIVLINVDFNGKAYNKGELENLSGHVYTKDKKDMKTLSTPPPICVNQKYLNISAWILLTVAVCIVMAIFCMAVLHNSNKVSKAQGNTRAVQSEEYLKGDFGQLHFENKGRNVNRFERLSVFGTGIEKNLNRCTENSCEIACENVADIYTAVHYALEQSLCRSISTLVMEQQDFPLGILKNDWLPSNISLTQVIIRLSKITIIKNNAFNTPLFKKTLDIALYNMNISHVESGALLGLYRLKYLTINSRVYKFEPAILQPVQSSLVKLKLNAFLKIQGNKNLFGGSYLNKVVHLDLSNNMFSGSLGKNLFKSTPNVNHLIITESQIRYVEKDAFEKLVDKLLFVDLSKNLLTTLSAEILQPIFVSERIFMINIDENNWICDCQLKELSELYRIYKLQFMDVLYCKTPYNLYGVTLDEVDFKQQNCWASEPTVQNNWSTFVTEPGRFSGSTTTFHTTLDNHFIKENSTIYPDTFKMRCFNSSIPYSGRSDTEYLQFPAASSALKLKLMPENNTVSVSVDNVSEVSIIWFSEQLESSVISYSNTTFDYDCIRYSVPELNVGPLQKDTTYTFCVLPALESAISPFNCLPLYVPPDETVHKDVWISEDYKRLTIGMLCLIFLLSTVAGALLAYFVFRTYPHIFKQSKNVVAAKKSVPSFCVATISGSDLLKQNSLKKPKPSIQKPLPATPPLETSALPYCLTVKDLKRLSSIKSSATRFADTTTRHNFADNEHEIEKKWINENMAERHSVPNTYDSSFETPPPLPKRNSNVSNP